MYNQRKTQQNLTFQHLRSIKSPYRTVAKLFRILMQPCTVRTYITSNEPSTGALEPPSGEVLRRRKAGMATGDLLWAP